MYLLPNKSTASRSSRAWTTYDIRHATADI